MDSEPIHPVKGSEVPVSKTRPSPRETAPAKPPQEVRANPEDTVSLSTAGKIALQTVGKEAPRRETSVASANKDRQFSVTENHDVVMKIVDSKTREVVKQVPTEEELQLRDAIRHMVENATDESSA